MEVASSFNTVMNQTTQHHVILVTAVRSSDLTYGRTNKNGGIIVSSEEYTTSGRMHINYNANIYFFLIGSDLT
jgi:hypothetical protein